ncbi:MAG: HAD family hydrolase [Promethearchaeota archaeon]
MRKNRKIVLSFDLDFTLINNKDGIINSFNYALKKYNIPEVNGVDIEEMIGTPLDSMFAKFSDLEPPKLTYAFREYYGSKGIFQVKLFKGVKKKLEELKQFFILGVITSKKQEMAIKLLKYLEIDNYFDFILGETDEIKSKIDSTLKHYLLNRYPDYKFVIIGDHPHDKMLAEMLESPFIGLLTGNHNEEQLKQNGKSKTLILNSVNEITIEKIYSLF